MFDFLDRGSLMEGEGMEAGSGGGALPGSAAVADAPEPSIEATSTEPGAEPAEPGAEGDTEPLPAGSAPGAWVQNGRPTAEAQAQFDRLKQENPQLASALKRIVFEHDKFRQAVPGGLREVQQMRQTLEDLGGEDGISQLQGDWQWFQDFDQKFTSADPTVLDDMLATPEGQQAFVQLGPAVLRKIAELNPDGYSAYIAQTVSSHFAARGLPMAMEKLGFYLETGDTQRAAQQVQAVSQILGELDQLSRQPLVPEREQPRGGPDNDRMQQLERQNSDLLRAEWRRETAQANETVFRAEYDRLLKGRTVTPEQKSAIGRIFEAEHRQIADAHAEKLNRYWEARDKQGFLKYASSLSKRAIPEALRKAFAAVLPATAGAPQKAKPAANGQKPPVNGGKPAPTGIMRVSKAPTTAEIDLRHPFNNPQNFIKGQAVLKNGKKVQWK